MKQVDKGDKEAYEAGVKKQRSFFWFGDPKLVIAMIQFMQFGYALALASLMVYWEDIDHKVDPLWYLAGVVVCYTLFLMVMAQVIPQYTLCTSLGYLVNQKHLQETVALFRLEEAQRKQRRMLLERSPYDVDNTSVVIVGEVDNNTKANLDEDTNGTSSSVGTPPMTTIRLDSLDSSTPVDETLEETDETSTKMSASKTQVLAELVKMDTSSLREAIPKQLTRKPTREQMMQQRRNRRKSVSDGVALMRAMTLSSRPISAAASTALDNDNDLPVAAPNPPERPMKSKDDSALPKRKEPLTRRERRRRQKAISASAVIQSWQDFSVTDSKQTNIHQAADLALISARRHSDSPLQSPGSLKSKDDSSLPKQKEPLTRRERRRRQKAISASAVIQSWQDFSVTDSNQTNIHQAADLALISARRHSDNPLQSPRLMKSKDDPAIPKLKEPLTRRERRMGQKALSASAVIQSWHEFSVTDSKQMNVHQAADLAPISARRHSDNPFHSPRSDPPFKMIEPEETAVDEVDITPIVENMLPSTVLEGPCEKNVLCDAECGNGDDVEDVNDDCTIDTSKSVGEKSEGGLSLVSVDVPQSDKGGPLSTFSHTTISLKARWTKALSPPAMKQRLRDYLSGPRYVSIDHLIGTLVCFYLVGSRVEVLLHGSDIVQAGDQSIVLKSHYSFWAEILWLFTFLLSAVAIIWLFPLRRHADNTNVRSLVLSAWLDLVISGSCLALLLYAESLRCCDNDDYQKNDYDYVYDGEYEDEYSSRRLAADYGPEYGSNYAYEENWYEKLVEDKGCCPMWGRRAHGGLGNIEPFTSLIGLRVARFALARSFVAFTEKRQPDSKKQDAETKEDDKMGKSPYREILFGQSETERHSMRNEKGTALELWEEAITKYPDIVAKYGEFSGELFQAMLGLQIVDATPPVDRKDAAPSQNGESSHQEEETEATEGTRSQVTELKGSHRRNRSLGQSFILAGKQYENLPVEAQEIIMAGKLGKPVCCASSRNLAALVGETGLPALHEDEVHADERHPVEFEIDDERIAREAKTETSGFIAPNARLVRSMRRCDRRLIPLLKKWIPVDVAMTQFEVVYFEAEDCGFALDNEFSHEKTSAHLALTATKGGKGLRLCDVAVGRKVVGHLDLTEITEIHVERDIPVGDLSLLGDLEDGDDVDAELLTEYWTDEIWEAKTSADDSVKHSRNIRWSKIKEDRLKLTSIHGTLILRFYSDLKDTESHLEQSMKENEEEGPLRKNISFQWAQTIGRFCGLDQLKQSLPHFGSNTSEELRDYLVVVHYHEKEAGKEVHKKTYVRKKSFQQDLDRGIPPNPTRGSRKSFRPSHSFGASPESIGGTKPSRKRLTRSVSAGDADTTPTAADSSHRADPFLDLP